MWINFFSSRFLICLFVGIGILTAGSLSLINGQKEQGQFILLIGLGFYALSFAQIILAGKNIVISPRNLRDATLLIGIIILAIGSMVLVYGEVEKGKIILFIGLGFYSLPFAYIVYSIRKKGQMKVNSNCI